MDSIATDLSFTHLPILDEFRQTRNVSLFLCENLETEDFVVQPVPEVSPLKWHLAHTTWFFAEMVLKKVKSTYVDLSPEFSVLFNSYYNSLGPFCPQAERGHLSRPTLKEILAYRGRVDAAIDDYLQTQKELNPEIEFVIRLGIEHEKQHQELFLMDLKYSLSLNVPAPSIFRCGLEVEKPRDRGTIRFPGGIYEIGTSNESFHFDNESPRHKEFLPPFSLQKNLVTNGEFLEFVKDGAYHQPLLWLSEAWDWVNKNNIEAPLYWRYEDEWLEFTLHGEEPLMPEAPVCHLSYYEADAYARWRQCRLPRENEAEVFLNFTEADRLHDEFNGFQSGSFHPTQASAPAGQLWFWTQSSYQAYPGFKPFSGALGEYNSKFMCKQYVLRGGSVATPNHHFRSTYRNFYEPHQRWMFSGLRLAKDIT